jgi:hypothetical protein
MDIGDQHDIGNYAFRMALQDQSIRQPADQVILHPEIGLAEQRDGMGRLRSRNAGASCSRVVDGHLLILATTAPPSSVPAAATAFR